MGKINSEAFCFFHNMKDTLWGSYSYEQLMTLNLRLSAAWAVGFANENTSFEKRDALYAFYAAISGQRDSNYATYEPYYKKYNEDFNSILADLVPALESWCGNTSDFNQEANGLLALVYISGRDTEKGNEILNLFLLQEERGMKIEMGIWGPLCALSDFEEWHDSMYGNPIIGKVEVKKDALTSNSKNLQQDQARSTEQSALLKELNRQTEENNKSDGNSGGCYIATAVYGSYDCPEVWTLRRFRDNFLATNWYGRTFIKVYYAVSPILVRWFGKTKWFNSIWRGFLDRFVNKLQADGYTNSFYIDKEDRNE